jgi:hypothetical protein
MTIKIKPMWNLKAKVFGMARKYFMARQYLNKTTQSKFQMRNCVTLESILN